MRAGTLACSLLCPQHLEHSRPSETPFLRCCVFTSPSPWPGDSWLAPDLPPFPPWKPTAHLPLGSGPAWPVRGGAVSLSLQASGPPSQAGVPVSWGTRAVQTDN